MAMYGFTDDPVADFLRHDREMSRNARRFPTCVHCKDSITDDFYYEIEGECVCFDCLFKHYAKDTYEYEG